MDETEPDELSNFVRKVIEQLTKNGFPEKRVSFSLERMYESAHKKGVNFNKVLEALEAQGIAHEKTPEKVIFGAPEPSPAPVEPPPFPGLDPAAFAAMTPEQRMAAAMAAMQQLSPAQLEALRGMVENMPEE